MLLSESLLSVGIVILGDDTALNWAVCQALSKRIGWFPVSAAKVLCGMQKVASIKELVDRDGREAVASYEADMLRGMRDQRRICVATLGDGASRLPQAYDTLHASLVVWIDEHDRRAPKPDTPERLLWAQEAEVPIRVVTPTGFGAGKRTVEDKAREVVGPLAKGALQLLKADPTLPTRKLMYCEMGCRGDWPNLMPANWNPVLDRMGAVPEGQRKQEEGRQQEGQQQQAAAA